MNTTRWTIKTVPMYPSRRWYALHWTGSPLSYLHDGRTCGRYKNRADAERSAAVLNSDIQRRSITP